MSGADTPILELRGVSVRYDGFAAVDDVSLALPRGGALGIVGESGAGKSTLARVAAGLITPAAGMTLLDGGPLPPVRRTRTQRRRIQMVFQNPDSSLNTAHTIRRILAEGMLLHGTLGPRPSRAAVDAYCRRLLAMVALGDDDADNLLDRRPDAFSGGQRQRIAIAARSPYARTCSSPTSRPARSTCPCNATCSTCSPRCGASGACPCCSSRMTWAWCARCATTWR